MRITEQQRRNIEFIERLLLIITLIIGIGVSTYKGYEFLTVKTSEAEVAKKQSEALTQESKKRTELVDLMGKSYLAQLEKINEEISKIDEEAKKEPWADTYKGRNLMAIREQKAKDRLQLLQIMGQQMLELKKLSR